MGKLDRLGLTDRFDVLAISEAEGIAKPDPRIFTATLERLGCSADETVMVGDSWSADVEGAHAAGLRAIWLNRYGRTCLNRALAFEIQAFEPLETVVYSIMNPAF
jgi:putative hydrolase of the HAD superfamily